MIGSSEIKDIMEAVKKQPNYISMSSQIIRLKELGIIDNGISDVL